MITILDLKRIFKTYSSEYFDKRKFNDTPGGILCGLNGTEHYGRTRRVRPVQNENIVGYMAVYSSGFDNPDLHSSLLTCGRYDGNGFFLRSDNYLEKLPLFAASRYITYNSEWTERARIMKSADSADRFHADVKSGKLDKFLLKTLLFTVLEMQNHMRTFTGSDNRFYRNELCFDTTNGETLASQDIQKLNFNSKEKELMELWKKILKYAKTTDGYDKTLTYGVYQIADELNTYDTDPITKTRNYHCLELQSYLSSLKPKVRDYYNSEIVPVLFEYEFLK